MGDYKLIEFYEDGHVELYNLKDDISEQNDLSKEKPELAAELLSRLKEWRISCDAKMPVMNKYYKP